MRWFWIIIGISGLLGATGAWAVVEGISQYNGTLRAYASMEVRYVPDSFVWQNPEFGSGRAEIRFTNGSPSTATVEAMQMFLRFDGVFAGATYEPFEAITLRPDETQVVEITFTVTSGSQQSRGGEANLAIDGWMRLDYIDLDRTVTLDIGDRIGVVDRVEE